LKSGGTNLEPEPKRRIWGQLALQFGWGQECGEQARKRSFGAHEENGSRRVSKKEKFVRANLDLDEAKTTDEDSNQKEWKNSVWLAWTQERRSNPEWRTSHVTNGTLKEDRTSNAPGKKGSSLTLWGRGGKKKLQKKDQRKGGG